MIPLFAGLLLFCSCKEKTVEKPNVILITIDTLRADHTGFSGYKNAETPVLDSLAQKALVAQRAYTVAPYTLPAHTSILTGTYPLFHGIRSNSRYYLKDDKTTLAEILKKNGYQTGAVLGSRVLASSFGLNQGFDYYEDKISEKDGFAFRYNERSGKINVDLATKWINQSGEPFFMWLHLFDPHSPYNAHRNIFGEKFISNPYDGEIAYTDRQIGKLIDFLKENNLLNTTLIAITADHGEGLGDHGELTHGYFIYEENVKVPLLFYFPSKIDARKIDEPVSVVDIFPTILEICGLGINNNIQGFSLLTDKRHESVYCENLTTMLDFGWSPLYGIISGKWKYIKSPQEELYDLSDDPEEKNNCINEKTKESKKLRATLNSFLESYGSGNNNDSSIKMTTEEEETLRSLGYLSFGEGLEGDRNADPKEMLEIYNAIRGAQENLSDELDGNNKGVHYKNPGIVYLENLLEKGVENSGIYRLLYDYYARKGQLEKALDYCEKTHKMSPEDYRVIESLGLINADLGNKEKALAYFEKARKIMPDDFSVNWMIATMSFELKKYDRALKKYEEIITLNPSGTYVGEAYLKCAIIYREQSEKEDALYALECANKAVSNYSVKKDIALIYQSMGKADEAIDIINSLLRLKLPPEEAASLCMLRGDIYIKLKKNPAACLNSYLKAIEYSNDEKLKAQLKEITEKIKQNVLTSEKHP